MYNFVPVNIALISMARDTAWGMALASASVEDGRRRTLCYASGIGNNKEWTVDLYHNYRITYIEITVPDSNG